ncbi:hypothetical protein GCM10011608_08290 [Micromonospora sonchi]|uniref:Uncharacterized protein n=1 Tax=Micromonospora sonchi TaxID=1763543 RepID=A0A917WSU0_9ACTN|nr:hypothetical protein [Micromonospora sonchi]GGM25875.1 hypothetical protein GCM10011608_08290 [Micromonospora sonchi]
MSVGSGDRDNQERAPSRSLNVGQNELEHAVREVLVRQAATPRVPAGDPATAIIRRANRIQRCRTAAGTSLAAMVVVLATAAAMQLSGERPPAGGTVVIGEPDLESTVTGAPTSPTTSPDTKTPFADVDLVLDATIATAQGRRIALVDTGRVERAHRLADNRGWLVIGPPSLAGRYLWAVAPDGTARVLLGGADEIVLDEEGQQVAWKQGTALAVARVVNKELITTVRAEAPAEAVPLRFVGGAVLVRLAPGRPGHVLWRLQPGQLDPGTDRVSTRIFGTLPDGRLVGEVTGESPGHTCVIVLNPAGLAPTGSKCGPELGGDGPGAVSPDGRWLLVNGRSGRQERVVLVDLRRLDPSVDPVPAGPAATGEVIWSAPGTAYYADAAGRLVRMDVDRVTAGRPADPLVIAGLPDGIRPVVVSGD